MVRDFYARVSKNRGDDAFERFDDAVLIESAYSAEEREKLAPDTRATLRQRFVQSVRGLITRTVIWPELEMRFLAGSNLGDTEARVRVMIARSSNETMVTVHLRKAGEAPAPSGVEGWGIVDWEMHDLGIRLAAYLGPALRQVMDAAQEPPPAAWPAPLRVAGVADLMVTGNRIAPKLELEQIHAAHGHRPETDLMDGLLLLDRRDFAGSEACFARAVDPARDHRAPLLFVGICRLLAEKPEEALQAFAEYADSGAGDPRAFFYLGLALQKLKKPEAVESAWMQAARLDPDEPLVAVSLGEILMAKGGDQRPAVGLLLHALRVAKDRNLRKRAAADLIASLFKARAAADMHKILDEFGADLEPGFVGLFRGIAFFMQGKTDEAIESLEDAAEIDETDHRIHNWLAQAYRKKGDLDKAIGAVDAALKADPRYANAYFLKACMLTQQGKGKAALLQLRIAAEIDPSYRERAAKEKDLEPLQPDESFQRFLKGDDGE